MALENYYSEHLLEHTAQSLDEFGDAITTTGEPSTILCYIGKPKSVLSVHLAKSGISVDGRLYAPLDANVAAFDIITDEAGDRWQVVTKPRDVAKRGHHVEADLKLLRGSENAN